MRGFRVGLYDISGTASRICIFIACSRINQVAFLTPTLNLVIKRLNFYTKLIDFFFLSRT